MPHDSYISPFSTRYASKEMQFIFSEDNKFRTWRKLWIALAKAEKKQGLDITDEQIAELEAHAEDINYDDAAAPREGVPPRRDEPRLRLRSAVPEGGGHHPSGRDVSCYVGDNTDVIIMREGLQLVRRKAAATC